MERGRMATHIDILEQQESLRTPLAASIALHAALFTLIAFYASTGDRARVLWGNPQALGGGGAVGITAVRQIPLPARSGATNPLAHDTESRVPAPPKPEVKPVQKTPEPEAIALRGRGKAQAERPRQQTAQSYRATPDKRNQVYSGVGQALSSQMYGTQTGTGGIQVGTGGSFGQQFGWYVELVKRRVGANWREAEIQPRTQRTQSIVAFEIRRDGSISNIRLVQTSGNYALDHSAQQAVYNARPFDPLPAQFSGQSVQIEVWFELAK